MLGAIYCLLLPSPPLSPPRALLSLLELASRLILHPSRERLSTKALVHLAPLVRTRRYARLHLSTVTTVTDAVWRSGAQANASRPLPGRKEAAREGRRGRRAFFKRLGNKSLAKDRRSREEDRAKEKGGKGQTTASDDFGPVRLRPDLPQRASSGFSGGDTREEGRKRGRESLQAERESRALEYCNMHLRPYSSTQTPALPAEFFQLFFGLGQGARGLFSL